MRIEHISIWTKALDPMKLFYMKYFNGISNDKYVNQKKQFESYFITFAAGVRLELMHQVNFEIKEKPFMSFGYAHLAFSVGSKEAVLTLTETLRNDGYVIHSEPRTTGDGYFESSVLDPDGNLVEITV